MKTPKRPNRVVTWQQRMARFLRHDIVVASLLAIAIIVVGAGLGYESNKLVPANPVRSAHYQDEAGNPLAFLGQWDSTHYIHIAEHSYGNAAGTNFFPLYPLAIRIVHIVVSSPLISALIVSWLSLAAATYLFLRCIHVLYPDDQLSERVQAALLLVLFPTGVFLFAAYTESLFLALALAAIYGALRKNWLVAAGFAGLASLAHLNGLFVAVFAALLLFEERQRWWQCAGVLAGGAMGLAAYLIYLTIRFSSPLVFLTAQAGHSTLHADPLRIASDLLTRNGIFFVLLVMACVYWWRHKRPSFALYTLLYVAIVFVGSHGMSGLGRYTLAALPLPLMFYDYVRHKPLAYTLVLVLSVIGWTYFTILYVAGYTGG